MCECWRTSRCGLWIAKGPKRAIAASSAAAPACTQRKTTVSQLARGKLRECVAFLSLSPTEKRLIVDPGTGLTLEKRLIRDVQSSQLKGVKKHFGKDENLVLAAIYKRGDSVFAQLKPPAECGEVPDPALRKVLQITCF